MKLQLAKGVRDLGPEQAITQKRIIETITRVFEAYGFSPHITPTFERFDLLASKYAGGAEILKETFKFEDQGKRELCLRYDLTVPLARYIGMNPEVKLPFKRYTIGNVYRDGPVEKARYREFTQCDVDIVGSSSTQADAELIMLASRAFKLLGLKHRIKINHRALLNDLLVRAGVDKKDLETVILSIDKVEKFGAKAVADELKNKKIKAETITNVMALFENNTSLEDLKTKMPDSKGLQALKEICASLDAVSVPYKFDKSLARGLSYYTGMVMEVVLEGSSVKSSVCGGGRFDTMIGNLLGKGEYPSTGISFGLDRIYDALVENNEKTAKTVTLAYIVPIDTYKESLLIAEELRNEHIPVEIDLNNRNPSKNIKYAHSKNIPIVIFVGKEELKQDKVKVKHMESGKEELMTPAQLVVLLQELHDKAKKP